MTVGNTEWSLEAENAIIQRLRGIPIFKTLEFSDFHFGKGTCKANVPHLRQYDGIFDCFHGGMLMTIADSAAALAVLTVCGAQSRIATTDMNIRFLAPAVSAITVNATVIKVGRTIVPVAAELQDASGTTVAIAQIAYMRL